MNRKPCIFNWSGGKDSALALYYLLQNPDYEVKYLVTTVNDSLNRISMHGVRESLLLKQAESLGIPLYQIRLPEMPGMKEYDEIMHKHLSILKAEGITHAVFGDIFLEDLRVYRESKLQELGMEAVFPLWKKDTTTLIHEFLDLGFKTVIACTQENLGDEVGKVIDADFINSLPANIDPCGENGEFHTFVFEGPIFKKSISYSLGEKVFKSYQTPKNEDDVCFTKDDKPKNLGFWYVDLVG
jgi:uncharacterized protein (TIGR00290 family)